MLAADPDVTTTAVEEMLRYDGPAKVVVRLVAEDHERDGKHFEKGQRVFLVNAAANRDPAKWHDPDSFDIRRDARQHLGFGFGIHYCLGAPLARLEAAIAVPLAFDLLPGLRLAGDLAWNPVILTRGLQALPVAWDVESL
jgi:cytochrome P450